MGLGLAGMFPDGVLSVPGHECQRSVTNSLHSREIHCHLSSHEGSGKFISSSLVSSNLSPFLLLFFLSLSEISLKKLSYVVALPSSVANSSYS